MPRPQIVWLSKLPRRFGIILEKILDRHERSGIAVQWNGGVMEQKFVHRNFGVNRQLISMCQIRKLITKWTAHVKLMCLKLLTKCQVMAKLKIPIRGDRISPDPKFMISVTN